MLRIFFTKLTPLYPKTLMNPRRWVGSSETENNESTDVRILCILKKKFPKAIAIHVEDISGGCGEMFEVSVEATEFEGLSKVKQHQLITNTLKEEIQQMHAIRIYTTVPGKK